MPQVMEPKEKAKTDSSKRVSLTKILVTTDFSEVSDHALDYAIAMARRYDARIYLAHVITPDPFQFAEPQLAQATYEKVRQAAEEGITDILISGKASRRSPRSADGRGQRLADAGKADHQA